MLYGQWRGNQCEGLREGNQCDGYLSCCITAENVCFTVKSTASAEVFPRSGSERVNTWCGSKSASKVCPTDRIAASVPAYQMGKRVGILPNSGEMGGVDVQILGVEV